MLRSIGAVLTIAFWLSVQPAHPELIRWTIYADTVAVAEFDDGSFGCCIKPDTLFRLPPWPTVCDEAVAVLRAGGWKNTRKMLLFWPGGAFLSDDGHFMTA